MNMPHNQGQMIVNAVAQQGFVNIIIVKKKLSQEDTITVCCTTL